MKLNSKWLKLATILGLVLFMAAGGNHAQAFKSEEAKHIILIIGDGMQLEHEIAASRYLYGRDGALAFHRFPYKGFVSTWDVTTYNRYAFAYGADPYSQESIDPYVGYDHAEGGFRPYPFQKKHISDDYFLTKLSLKQGDTPKYPATDSASAATAWATGFKVDDGNIAWLPGDPADGALKTIAELLREKKGRSIGVVSTVPFSHATPAAHVSHNVSRSNYAAIAEEIILKVQPEVVIGGGLATSYIPSALYNDLKAGKVPAYKFVERQSGVDGARALRSGALAAAADGKKLFGLFGGPGGNFESPVPTDDGSSVVERAIIENPLLKDAALAALTVLRENPKGFFLMLEQGDIDWANHANDYKRMIGTMWDLEECVREVVDFVDQPGDGITWKNTLVIVTADHGNSYMRLNDDKRLGAGDLPEQNGTTYPGGEVTYASTEHTNELVTLYAMGNGSFRRLFHEFEGSWYPRTRIIDNTQLFHIMMAASGCPVEPQLSLVESAGSSVELSVEERN